MFLSTNGMEKKGCREWILRTTRIEENRLINPIEINPFSFEDIEAKLDEVINGEDSYIVNLTGGTKIMSLAAYEFFKDLSSEIYYLTGRGEYLKLHPGRKKNIYPLKSKVTLQEYLTSYGFELKDSSQPLRSQEESKLMLSYFLTSFNRKIDIPILGELRNHRSRKNISFERVTGLADFLERIGFKPEKENKISKYECRYLTGDWLEEYLYFFLMENFNITKDEIGLSWVVDKNGTLNEFDVLLMRNNKLYLFECKTSIYLDQDEKDTFIGETIYKSDSLRNKFGLFTQTIVFTLSDLNNTRLEKHLDRAEASRVKLIGKSMINKNLKEALEI